MSSVPRSLALAVALAALGGVPIPAVGQPAERTEPEAKAVFLQKVLDFITWPKGERAAAQPLKIAFLGHTQVGRDFARLTEKRPAGSPAYEVHYVSLDANLDDYQVIFLPSSSARRAPALAERCATKPVLTVCESPGGCDKGIILTLLISEDRIRYDVNLNRARKAGLTFHSQVLHYAAKVCEGSAP